ncbi:hypothetical protein VTH82DRAFT_6225 [Thermothelomyces myriococcoides]
MIADADQAGNNLTTILPQSPFAQPAAHLGNMLPNAFPQGLDIHLSRHVGNDFQLSSSESGGSPPLDTSLSHRSSQQLQVPQPSQGLHETSQPDNQLPDLTQVPWALIQDVLGIPAMLHTSNESFLSQESPLPRFEAVPNYFESNGAYQAALSQSYHIGVGNTNQVYNIGDQNLIAANHCQLLADNQHQGNSHASSTSNHIDRSNYRPIISDNSNDSNRGKPASQRFVRLGPRALRNADLVARGLCIWCKKPNPAPTKSGCPPCLVKRAKITERWRQKRRHSALRQAWKRVVQESENEDANMTKVKVEADKERNEEEGEK